MSTLDFCKKMQKSINKVQLQMNPNVTFSTPPYTLHIWNTSKTDVMC